MNKPKKTCVVEAVNPKSVTGEGNSVLSILEADTCTRLTARKLYGTTTCYR